jgi:TctA family transporter
MNFRRALLAGKGSITPFFTRGISIGMIAFIVLIVGYQYFLSKKTSEQDRTVILK